MTKIENQKPVTTLKPEDEQQAETLVKKNNQTRNILLAVAIIVSILLVIALFFWPKKTDQSSSIKNFEVATQTNNIDSPSPPKLIIGDPNAKVSIIEYADFKCPLCGKFYREIEPQIKKDYIDTGKINIEYRPLPVISPDSTVAALGAYCALEQGKFELYHNAVFDYIYKDHYSKSLKDEFANIFTLEKLTQISVGQGIDANLFTTCMTSNKYSSAIEASEANAKLAGASGTPTVVIGSQNIAGTQPYAIYKPLIEAQLR